MLLELGADPLRRQAQGLREVLGLPDWARRLSPFSHVPALPGGEMAWGPLVVLLVIAGALILVGMLGFRRRDLG